MPLLATVLQIADGQFVAYASFSGSVLGLGLSWIGGASMPNVHGVEFNANQSELVKEIVRELLKDGNCAVYAVPHIKPNGELRIASTPPLPTLKRQTGVFLRIRPGVNEATIVRPMNAKAGEPLTKLTKFSLLELLGIVRLWRQQTMPDSRKERTRSGVFETSLEGI
jgi:hypothetical protein